MHSTKAPSTRIRFCLKTEIFSFGLSYAHTCLVKTVTEYASFRKRSLEWRFLKTLPSRRRRTKTGVFEYDDVKNYFVFHRFNVLVWTSENDSNALRVDAYYFENGRSPFSKICGYLWMGFKICGKFLLKLKERMRI